MQARLPMEPARTLRDVSCADDYDPNSLPVERARALIREFLAPVTAVERVHIRAALGRVLAADVLSPIDVPGHDNSAMDGWAVRFADLDPAGTTLRRVGESFAGKPFAGALGRAYGIDGLAAGARPTGTTHVSVVDGDGAAIGLSSTLGSGSGVFRHGFQLNNMLGETDLNVASLRLVPGMRLTSMMAPSLVLEDGSVSLVAGSSGSARTERRCG